MLDPLDKKIIAAMQDDFPLVPEPYKAIAAKLGIKESELLARLDKYRATGAIRKMGAVLKHREVGFQANALCVWNVPEERLDEVGQIMAEIPSVTHCYARAPQPEWPYNFYTMLHGHSRAECEATARQAAKQAGIRDYVLLYSTREWKKSSMRYFREAEEC